MFLYGYGPQLAEGLALTLQLASLSLVLAFALGLFSATASLSKSRIARICSICYTTLIRGVPDLVTMLILFYGVQMLLNSLTESMEWGQITINPFSAGVLTLGFIYGAYFSETLRGAFIAVPKGSIEAAHAFGMRPRQVFVRILFPQMMRYALPGIANNWQVLLKSTALVSIIGLNDVVRVANQAGKASSQFFFFIGLSALMYLAITTASQLALRYLEKRYSHGVKMAAL
ncbi:MAG: ABC transporter permease [Burkholderiales bacterium]|nr:ABC transporter permease [Burkholderiales bacterium]